MAHIYLRLVYSLSFLCLSPWGLFAWDPGSWFGGAIARGYSAGPASRSVRTRVYVHTSAFAYELALGEGEGKGNGVSN